jgi:hypothetical protein
MIKDLKVGLPIKLDPTLKLLIPDSIIRFPEKDERLIVKSVSSLIIDSLDNNIKVYELENDKNDKYRIIDDISAKIIFIYHLKFVAMHNIVQPPFIANESLNLDIDDVTHQYGFYSDVLNMRIGNAKLITRVYERKLPETSDADSEYLWCEINNNTNENYFVGVNIHETQIII